MIGYICSGRFTSDRLRKVITVQARHRQWGISSVGKQSTDSDPKDDRRDNENDIGLDAREAKPCPDYDCYCRRCHQGRHYLLRIGYGVQFSYGLPCLHLCTM